jgi:hypothetical protein
MSILRRPFSLLHPLRRSAWIFMAWSQRHSLALWWHSLRAELRPGRPVDVGRIGRLASVLARVTIDPRLSNAPELKQISIDDGVLLAHADEHWSKRPILTSTLANVSHIKSVQFA